MNLKRKILILNFIKQKIQRKIFKSKKAKKLPEKLPGSFFAQKIFKNFQNFQNMLKVIFRYGKA
jgi:hypothetical protein